MDLTPVLLSGNPMHKQEFDRIFTSNEVTIAYFHIISNILFCSDIIIRRSVVSITDSIVK
jgi:hypothetical protein